MEFSKSNDKIVFFSINYGLLFIGFVCYGIFYTKVKEPIEYILYCFLALMPVAVAQAFIHFNYANLLIDKLIINKDKFHVIINNQVLIFNFSDITNVNLVLTPNNYKDNIHFLPWDDYYYLRILFQDGEVLVISSLLGNEVRNEFLKRCKIETEQKIFPVFKG